MKRRMHRAYCDDRRGLTLVELMVSLTIFGVILAVVFGVMSASRESYTDTREKVQYQQSMRAVISMMTRELRSAGCDPAGTGFEKIAVADLLQLRIRSDLNGDADTIDSSPDEDVTYTFDPATGNLTRNDGAVDQVILRGLLNLTFSYFDEAGVALAVVPLSVTDRALVRFVEVDIDGESDRGEPVHYTSRVLARNF